MLRYDRTPIIFLINNDGYTIERVIHGPKMAYNDVHMWKYSELPQIFGDNTWSRKVSTEDELQAALEEMKGQGDKLRFVEVIMDKNDTPDILTQLGVSAAEQNSY